MRKIFLIVMIVYVILPEGLAGPFDDIAALMTGIYVYDMKEEQK